MTQAPSFRDAEQLSAYLDNQLSPVDRQRLEARLKDDTELRSLLTDLSQVRAILRNLPARKAPRNFRLTPEMAGIRPPLPRIFPVFRLASALAAVLLFFAFAANLTLPALSAFRAAMPAPAMQVAGPADRSAAPLAPSSSNAGVEAAPTASEAYPVPPAAPMAGHGIGGGPTGSDTALPQATAPAALLAPQTLDTTPTPELRMLLPEATQTPEIPAAAETLTEPGPMAKSAPSDLNQPPPEAPQPEPIRAPVPAWLLFGLLGLAVVSGSTAYFLRARAERAWFKAYALSPARPTTRQVVLFILAFLLVAALVAAIVLLSSAGSYAP